MIDSAQVLMALVAVGILRYIDHEDEQSIKYARIAFATAVLVEGALLFTILLRVFCKRASLKTLWCSLGHEVKNESLAASKKKVEISFYEYDLDKLGRLALKVIVAAGIATYMHFIEGYFPPLIFQAAVMPVTVFNSELVWIHILCYSDHHGELKRPWEQHQQSIMSMFREVKREMRQTMGKGGAAGGVRRNKTGENKRRAFKRK